MQCVIKRFEETGQVEDKIKSGSPKNHKSSTSIAHEQNLNVMSLRNSKKSNNNQQTQDLRNACGPSVDTRPGLKISGDRSYGVMIPDMCVQSSFMELQKLCCCLIHSIDRCMFADVASVTQDFDTCVAAF